MRGTAVSGVPVHLFLGKLHHLSKEIEENMFENLTLVIILIVVFWLGAFGYYLYTSRQQKEIVDELEKLNKKLDESEKHS